MRAALALWRWPAGGAALRARDAPPAPRAARAPTERPTLALLTSLPLLFGESSRLDGGGSPALARLERDYHVVPIAVADAASLAGIALLLMAHPRAQPAEVLVELDAWVRGGGRLVLLADPVLEWQSERPLGDPLRPPPDFADTGLLGALGAAARRADERRGDEGELLSPATGADWRMRRRTTGWSRAAGSARQRDDHRRRRFPRCGEGERRGRPRGWRC